MLACVCQPAEARLLWGGALPHQRLAPPRAAPSKKPITRPPQRNNKRTKQLPGEVQLTLVELREMACRQQQQIDTQQQLLAAKEQRLRYLKEQEARHQRVAAENERLRRLRERVEAQELKLRKLRALRGQVDQHRQSNVSLTSDLDSIRALFNEKEKELSLAVAKVDELTRQLEDLRRGSGPTAAAPQPSAAALELDKLRRELMYRNKLNEQQNARLCQQREALTQRQEEMANIDKRIGELQDRLHRKRVLNQQLANQISATAASHKQHQPSNTRPPHNGPVRGNIAAVEPYKHVPQQQQQPPPEPIKPPAPVSAAPLQQLDNQAEFLPEFAASKADPKYQTLPYNTKFTVNFVTTTSAASKQAKDLENNNWQHHQQQQQLEENKGGAMTVHSTPLSQVNKSLATPLGLSDKHKQNKPTSNGLHPPGKLLSRGQPVGQPAPPHKPVSSVAPTNKAGSSVPPTILVSSTKIQPVQPQQLALSPPQGASTPLGTPELAKDQPKPALPPKPCIRPPPRQTAPVPAPEEESKPSSTPPAEPPPPAIKARPLTIKKQQLAEQPRLRSAAKPNGYHISINRRIEMPPAFLFPEMDTPPDLLPPASTPEDTTPSPQEKEESASEDSPKTESTDEATPTGVVMRKKGNLKSGKAALQRRVSFDPLALLLDASLEGELELVRKTAAQVANPSAANDEGITALHNAICAGHLDIVKFLVEFGCDVNAQDSDGWTPLHCAASCNNVAMVRFLVEHGACIFATTLSDHETAAEKCEEDEEGFDGCSEYLYSVQEKLGILSGGAVFAVFEYQAQQSDELSFASGQQLTVLRKGDEHEREWWWAASQAGAEGYIPRNLLGLCPRVTAKQED